MGRVYRNVATLYRNSWNSEYDWEIEAAGARQFSLKYDERDPMLAFKYRSPIARATPPFCYSIAANHIFARY